MAVAEVFQALYDNDGGIQDSFIAYWKEAASYFKNEDNVLGYELINEPFVGNFYKDASLFLDGKAGKKFLLPMYVKIHEAIRSVDDKKIIFIEP